MPDVKFNCEHCNQPLEAPRDMLGSIVDCPKCQQSVVIPETASIIEPTSPAFPPPPVPKTKLCPFCSEEIQTSAVKCKHCGEFLDEKSKPKEEQIKAQIKTKTETAGVGCLIQGFGLLIIPAGFLFGFGMGLIVTVPLGIVLLIIGSRKSSYPVCSNCGNKLTGKDVSVCPACKATFEQEPSRPSFAYKAGKAFSKGKKK